MNDKELTLHLDAIMELLQSQRVDMAISRLVELNVLERYQHKVSLVVEKLRAYPPHIEDVLNELKLWRVQIEPEKLFDMALDDLGLDDLLDDFDDFGKLKDLGPLEELGQFDGLSQQHDMDRAELGGGISDLLEPAAWYNDPAETAESKAPVQVVPTQAGSAEYVQNEIPSQMAHTFDASANEPQIDVMEDIIDIDESLDDFEDVQIEMDDFDLSGMGLDVSSHDEPLEVVSEEIELDDALLELDDEPIGSMDELEMLSSADDVMVDLDMGQLSDVSFEVDLPEDDLNIDVLEDDDAFGTLDEISDHLDQPQESLLALDNMLLNGIANVDVPDVGAGVGELDALLNEIPEGGDSLFAEVSMGEEVEEDIPEVDDSMGEVNFDAEIDVSFVLESVPILDDPIERPVQLEKTEPPEDEHIIQLNREDFEGSLAPATPSVEISDVSEPQVEVPESVEVERHELDWDDWDRELSIVQDDDSPVDVDLAMALPASEPEMDSEQDADSAPDSSNLQPLCLSPMTLDLQKIVEESDASEASAPELLLDDSVDDLLDLDMNISDVLAQDESDDLVQVDEPISDAVPIMEASIDPMTAEHGNDLLGFGLSLQEPDLFPGDFSLGASGQGNDLQVGAQFDGNEEPSGAVTYVPPSNDAQARKSPEPFEPPSDVMSMEAAEQDNDITRLGLIDADASRRTDAHPAVLSEDLARAALNDEPLVQSSDVVEDESQDDALDMLNHFGDWQSYQSPNAVDVGESGESAPDEDVDLSIPSQTQENEEVLQELVRATQYEDSPKDTQENHEVMEALATSSSAPSDGETQENDALQTELVHHLQVSRTTDEHQRVTTEFDQIHREDIIQASELSEPLDEVAIDEVVEEFADANAQDDMSASLLDLFDDLWDQPAEQSSLEPITLESPASEPVLQDPIVPEPIKPEPVTAGVPDGPRESIDDVFGDLFGQSESVVEPSEQVSAVKQNLHSLAVQKDMDVDTHFLLAQPSAPIDDDEEDFDFDFDLGLQVPEDHIGGVEEDLASKTGVPALESGTFDRQKTPTNSPQPDVLMQMASDVPHDAGASLAVSALSIPEDPALIHSDGEIPEDEFFLLADSLAIEQSLVLSDRRQYRGEPVMRGELSSPGLRQPIISQAYSVESNPKSGPQNPFAHEAPTGVKAPLEELQEQEAKDPFELEEISLRMDATPIPSKVLRHVESLRPGQPESVFSSARQAFEAGAFSEALVLVEQAIKSESSEEAESFKATIIQEQERQQLLRLGSLSKTPRLKASMNEIAGMSLDHRAGFLLSMFDGMMTFEDILDVSMMPRLETMTLLADLIDKQVIEVD